MEELELGGWRIACDRAATRRATARMPQGAAAACGCDACALFVAGGGELLADEVLEALERLGCDRERECELAPLARTPGGGFEVAVAWRFAGRVLAEPGAPTPFRIAADAEAGPGLARLEVDLSLAAPAGE